MRKKLTVARNFLYRLVFIGLVINVAAQFAYMAAAKHEGINLASKLMNITPFYLSAMITSSIVLTRAIFLYFVLLPALALHWTVARDKHLIEKKEGEYAT